MSKLFKIKEWLSVFETARHLSIVFGEEVTEADVLRLALDGRLQLSVYFVNRAKGRIGKIARYTPSQLNSAIKSGDLPEDLEWLELPSGAMAAVLPDIHSDEAEKPQLILKSLKIAEDQYLTLSDEITTLTGVWDLPMIGNEALDVEHKYQTLTNGPAVTVTGLEGAFVKAHNGAICQLQDDLENNSYVAGSNASLEDLQQIISDIGMDASQADALLARHKEERKKFLEERRMRPIKESYYPVSGLPIDSILVIRVEALTAFLNEIGEGNTGEKPLSTTERNTLLTVIAALCNYSDIDIKARGVAGTVAKLTEDIGAAVTDDTIRDIFRKIPDALEGRKK